MEWYSVEDKKVIDKQENEEQNVIKKEELDKVAGQEIDAFTRIKDENVIKDMRLPSNIDRRSVVVAKVGNEFKVYAKEIGEDGEIINVSDGAYEIDQKNSDEVTRLHENKEYDESLGATIKLNRDSGLELNMIMENGQIKVGRVERDEFQ